MRVKAASIGLPAEEYLAEQAVDSGWTGMAEFDALGATRSTDLYEDERMDTDAVEGLPVNTGLVISLRARLAPWAASRGAARCRSFAATATCSALHGRSAEQRLAIDLLLDHEWASSRSAVAPARANPPSPCAPGLEAVLERQPAQEDHRLPAALRGRRPGTRLPARRRRPRK